MRTAFCLPFLSRTLVLGWLFASSAHSAKAQAPEKIQQIFPPGTIQHSNIPYAGDTLKKHLLDIYLPPGAKEDLPVVIWFHGGAWMFNDKYADMGYMKNTVRSFLDSGYALASIDYRHSTTAVFPAQIRDCNQAIEFLYQNAGKYKLNKEKFAVIGFSAGGHLASLLALSNNNKVKEFYPDGKKPSFRIRLALDFYGPSDFVAIGAAWDDKTNASNKPEAILLGASPLERPDLAKAASPVTYVDKGDPPFLIVQGEKDQSVPYTQSVLLSSWLRLAGVKNELVIVPGAPHFGPMFDADEIRVKVFRYLREYLME